MKKRPGTSFLCAGLGALLFGARASSAHGIVGNRFFPPTISTDDPFAADELALPTLSYVKNAGGDGDPSNHELDAGFEFDKLILPHLSIGINDVYVYTKPDHAPAIQGWTNFTLNLKYEVWKNDDHEAIVSVGLYSEIGGTGGHRVGANSFSTFTPALFFGKGFGDLPDSLSALKPFAVTGVLGQSFPMESSDSNAFSWGFAVEYSLPYLQQHVRNIGLPAPFKDMISVVEFAMATAENRDGRGLTTGTINPGVMYETPYFQLGAEANIPVNHQSGAHVGVTVQMWIFIDDIFPHTFGPPLFGASNE